MSEELSTQPIDLIVEARAHGWRVDHYLSRLYSNYSRGLFQRAIDSGAVLVNGLEVKPSRRLRVNDCISVRLPDEPDSSIPPENIPLDILHEDDAIVVLNKSPNMIVHPGKGNYSGTLAGALQYHFDQLSDVAGAFRPGIVHRLDRDTSGVLVIAKDNQVHNNLSTQFENREVTKQYRAIVWGELQFDSDYIETHVRVHPKHREKMQVCAEGGNARHASTFYEVIERFRGFSYVRMFPKTGRTHQLRIHMQYIGNPIVADRVYGGRRGLLETNGDLAPLDDKDAEDKSDILISRQALHAYRLEFTHPKTMQQVCFEAPIPAEFQQTLDSLKKYRKID